MQQRVLKIADLANSKKRKGQLNVSPSTVWRWVKIGGFPSPFKIGLNTTVWDASEVDAWLATRKEATK